MKNYICKIILLLLLMALAHWSKADTLDVILQSALHDSVKMDSVFSLVRKYNANEQYNKTIQVGERALLYFKNLQNPKKESALIVIIAIANYYKGNYAKALEYYFKSLKIRQEMNDVAGQGSLLNNIGIIYQDLENFDTARDYLFQGLAKRQQNGDGVSIGKSFNNIGLMYYTKGSKMAPEVKEQLFDSAMYYFSLSLGIAKSFGNKSDISYSYSNMGNVLVARGKTTEALEHYQKSLKMQEEMDDKINVAVSNIQIGDLYKGMGNYKKAIDYFNKALKMAEELENPDNMKICYLDLSYSYEQSGNYKLSLELFKKFSSLKDTLINAESNKQMAELQTIYDTEKKDAEINLLNKDKEIQAGDIKKQRIIIYSAIAVILLVLALVFFVYSGYKQKRLANFQLERKNREIKEKNEEILSSIRYAKRIQNAMLTSSNYIAEEMQRLKAEAFIAFQPKDIVSGDFYWLYASQNVLYYITADCTGHGVPGGFMSMLCINLLNEIVIERNETDPATIFNMLRKEIIRSLKTDEGYTKDGMDAILCKIDFETMTLNYAAANNSFYVIRNNEILEQKAQKMPVGYQHNALPFETRTVQLQKGDTVYSFTDGFADQFGGPKGKKLMYRKFEDILLANTSSPLGEQKEKLQKAFQSWKGDLEQVDDVTVIGVRV